MPIRRNNPFHTFAEFWPFYLSQHRRQMTQRLHVVGTSLAILVLLVAIIAREPSWLLAALIIGSGFAWFAHAFIEKNRPATFTHPFWSLRGDLKIGAMDEGRAGGGDLSSEKSLIRRRNL